MTTLLVNIYRTIEIHTNHVSSELYAMLHRPALNESATSPQNHTQSTADIGA